MFTALGSLYVAETYSPTDWTAGLNATDPQPAVATARVVRATREKRAERVIDPKSRRPRSRPSKSTGRCFAGYRAADSPLIAATSGSVCWISMSVTRRPAIQVP